MSVWAHRELHGLVFFCLFDATPQPFPPHLFQQAIKSYKAILEFLEIKP